MRRLVSRTVEGDDKQGAAAGAAGKNKTGLYVPWACYSFTSELKADMFY